MSLSFTLQDTFSMLLGILLFPSVLVFPGYVIGWVFDIYSFKERTLLAQYVMAIALSNAAIPIILFLAFRFVSNQMGIGVIIAFFLLWVVIQMKLAREYQLGLKLTQGLKIAFTIALLWIGFYVFLLVDIQIGQRLYFNAAAYDFTTRTALIEAITRTGIPPINPSYFPGHFERITELYYFWYILGSAIDTLGGNLLDARIALFAGITWSGLSLIATIATYLRIRNQQSGIKVWRSVIRGVQLLAVSGLDFIPVIAIMIAAKTTTGNLPFEGRIEGWNQPIMSWLNALTWVPNHVTSMAACMIALLAVLSSRRATGFRWMVHVILAGASLASAFGLSVWVTFTFGVFLAVWAISLLFQKNLRGLLSAILVASVVGLIVITPFFLDLLQSGGKSEITGGFPIGLHVRPFGFSQALSPGLRDIVAALLLPLNHFFELGLFFIIAVIWIRQRLKSNNWENNFYWKAEMLLLTTVAILLAFMKSTILSINDLGIRGWLLGQFILIIWTVDILDSSTNEQPRLSASLIRGLPASKQIKDLIIILLIVGIATTALEVFSTRFWTILVDQGVVGVPNELSPDTNLGKRTYDSRLAYEFIRDHTPQDFMIQNNPTVHLDRPSGLYGRRQMIIADRTAYGVPLDVFRNMSTSIGQIFLARDLGDWDSIDNICDQYSIQAIVVNDTDPLWSSLAALQTQRTPIYINRHYAVFRCGNAR